jgi:6-phosphogluconolactonase
MGWCAHDGSIMTTKVVPGQLVAVPDLETLAIEAASRMGRALRDAQSRKGSASLALSGGETPRPAYEKLANEKGIDWSRVEVFWIDERAVPPTDDRSNFKWGKSKLLDHVSVPSGHVHRMAGDAPDLEAAARDYETLLRSRLSSGGFDVAVLGVGDDGHTASLFPGETGVHELTRWVIAVPAAPEKKREARLTVTTPVIEASAAVFVLAAGKGKHDPLQRAWSTAGSVDETPARVLRGVRGSLTWIIDKTAGGMS